MAGSETRKLAMRSLSKRPAETVLLIIGIALGIGTTAGGIAMVANLRQEGDALLQSTQYREIVVSTRDSAADMEVSAYLNEADATVILTGADLKARDLTPDIQYAYTAARRRIRIGNFGLFQGGQQPQGQTRGAGEQGVGGDGDASQAQDAQTEGPLRGGGQGGGEGPGGAGDAAAGQSDQTEGELRGGGPGGGERPAGSRDAAAGQFGGGRGVSENVASDEESSEAGGEDVQGARESAQAGRGDQGGGFNFDFVREYSDLTPVIEEIDVVQITPEFFDAYSIVPERGSLFTRQEIDAERPVAVVGSELAKVLYEDGVALGRELLLFGTLYEIIGVAEPTGPDRDMFAFYPSFTSGAGSEFAAALARFGGFGSSLRFTVFEADRLEEAEAQLQSHFDSTYGAGAVVVRTPGVEARATIGRNARLVTIIMFLAIAGLFIAAVNVSNILYGRAMRKRRSVGILKALGATQGGVFKLFLTEALAIGSVGAILGVAVSIGFTRLLGETYASASAVTGPMLAGALGGLIITLGLTIIPALQAATIPAAEALRYE